MGLVEGTEIRDKAISLTAIYFRDLCADEIALPRISFIKRYASDGSDPHLHWPGRKIERHKKPSVSFGAKLLIKWERGQDER